MAVGAEVVHMCSGCATHPALLPAPRRRSSALTWWHRRVWRRSAARVRVRSGRRSWARRLVMGTGALLAVVVATLGGLAGLTIYRIDHAVHHVSLPAGLLARGKNDLLAVVRGPEHHEDVYVFRTQAGTTKILHIPGTLDIAGTHGVLVPISALSIDRPAAIVRAVRALGVPVGRYIGVDLAAAAPTSSLGRLALGTLPISSILADPAGASSLLEAVASHVYLGPHTSVSSLLGLMHVSGSQTLQYPTTATTHGTVVLASGAPDVLRHFL